jgi:hypothetical protein
MFPKTPVLTHPHTVIPQVGEGNVESGGREMEVCIVEVCGKCV